MSNETRHTSSSNPECRVASSAPHAHRSRSRRLHGCCNADSRRLPTGLRFFPLLPVPASRRSCGKSPETWVTASTATSPFNPIRQPLSPRTPVVSNHSLAARAVLIAALVLAVPALADPPSHAPAHGWRKKHDPYYVGYTGREWEHDYGIIEGECNRDAIGAVIGGVVGGAVGSQVGDGSGRVVAIVVGTVIGAAIGREIGEELDDRDRACIGHALELAKDGQSVHWLNENDGLSYVVTPIAVDGDSTCRVFDLVISGANGKETQRGHACRTSDGTWQMSP